MVKSSVCSHRRECEAGTQVRISVMVLALAASSALGQGIRVFEQPMSTSAKAEYGARLTQLTVEQLRAEFNRETSLHRIRTIVAELSLRGADGAAALEQCSRPLEANDPATRMVRADIQIALARIGNSDRDYVMSLGKMLSAGDAYVVDAVAAELGRIGSAEAIATLRSQEKQGRPMIKIARLQAECRGLPVELSIEAILESARSTIRERDGNGAQALVAEGSMLAWLGEAAGDRLGKELASAPAGPRDVFWRQYGAFLERSLEGLQRAKVMRGTATAMSVATMPVAASTPSRRTSSQSVEILVPSETEVQIERQDEGGRGAKLECPTDGSGSSSLWVSVWAGAGMLIIACIILAIRISRKAGQQE